MKRLLFTILGAAAIAAPAYAQNATPPPAPAPLPTASAATIQATFPVTKSGATPAPPKDVDENRVGISGVWEIAIQRENAVVYTHFKLTQVGASLTGQYLDENGKRFPLTGTVNGKDVHVIVTLADGSALVFEGSQDGGTDMVGTLTTTKDMVGFTAAYRPKYKWIDNLTPGTGGIGGQPGIP